MEKIRKEYKGIMLSALLGLAAYIAGDYTPSTFNSILIALLMGMLAGNLFSVPHDYHSGIGLTSGKLLELSILFLAFSINYTHIAKLGAGSFSIIAVLVLAMLLLTYYLAIKIKCPGSTSWLIGFGTAICGSSAIAALAPSISKSKEDVGIAMAVINLFGSLGMIALPMLLMKTNMDITEMGLLLGGSLHSVGNVAGAGYAISNEVGEAAITIKLARVALLSPALIFFNFLINHKSVNNWKEHFKLPWYLWSFVLITILTSFVNLPAAFTGMMDSAGKIILTIAMAAIGLKVSLRKLFHSGRKGVTFGIIVFAIQLTLLALLSLFL